MKVTHLAMAIGSFVAGAGALKKAFDDEEDGTRRLDLNNGPHSGPPMRGKPRARIRHVHTIDQRLAAVMEQMNRSVRDPYIRHLAGQLVSKRCRAPNLANGDGGWCYPERAYWQEVKAVYNFVRANVRYVRDIHAIDTFQTARRTLEMRSGDCFPEGTLLLTDDYRLTPIEHLRAGQKIWGRNRWSEVGAVGPKGIRQITSVKLNNGSWLRLTDEHKVFIAECPRHPRNRKSGPCSCRQGEREILRIAVAELEPDMVLVQPESIQVPELEREESLDDAWLTGAFLADGWMQGPASFRISGRDGFWKEATKKRVEAMMSARGIDTSWGKKSITVKDEELASRFAELGRGAHHKKLVDLRFSASEARSLIDGFLLDASKNTSIGHTFGSTSRDLAIQMRVLNRMLGHRTGWSTVHKHGGFGNAPIHRVTVRDLDSEKAQKLLRVVEVERFAQDEEMTWDMRTDDHFVYLPEHDVTVSNCDDFTITLGALLMAVGFPVRSKTIQTKSSRDFNHIYLQVGLPPTKPTRWKSLDASTPNPAGWEAPKSMIARARLDYPDDRRWRRR